jgi:long-subunit acyl-CoA synthetase (AMP-forming)
MVALWDMGCTVFVINTKLADETLISLLQSSNTSKFATSPVLNCIEWLMVPGNLANRAIDKIQSHLSELKIGVFDTIEKPTNEKTFFIEPILQVKDATNAQPAKLAKSEDIAIIMHTSGTTKIPKLVPITHYNVLYSLSGYGTKGGFWTKQDYLLGALPFFHLMGFFQFVGSMFRGSIYPFA